MQSPSVTAKPLNTTLKLTSPRTVSRTTLTKTETKPTQMTSDSVPVSYASVLPTVPESPRTVSLSPPTVTESPPMVSYSIPTVWKVPPTVSEVEPTGSEVSPLVSEVEPTGSDAPRTTLVPQSTASDTTRDLLTNVRMNLTITIKLGKILRAKVSVRSKSLLTGLYYFGIIFYMSFTVS